jgi:LmbE family N-acetylglucosaminyl deacetylase
MYPYPPRPEPQALPSVALPVPDMEDLPVREPAQVLRRFLNAFSRPVSELSLRRSALVFAPHPDDECLGCGGTILKKKRAGAAVKLVYVTDGDASHPHLMSKDALKQVRKCESLRASATLGVDQALFLGFDDGTLFQHQQDATEQVRELLLNEQPQELFIPYCREPMRHAADHVALTRIVRNALNSYTGRVTVWEYPIWFWLHWPWVSLYQKASGAVQTRHIVKNSLQLACGWHAFRELRYTVDISEVLHLKWAALNEHRSQMTRLIPTPEWTTLPQICDGEFLESFRYTYEFFRCTVHEGRRSKGARMPASQSAKGAVTATAQIVAI